MTTPIDAGKRRMPWWIKLMLFLVITPLCFLFLAAALLWFGLPRLLMANQALPPVMPAPRDFMERKLQGALVSLAAGKEAAVSLDQDEVAALLAAAFQEDALEHEEAESTGPAESPGTPAVKGSVPGGTSTSSGSGSGAVGGGAGALGQPAQAPASAPTPAPAPATAPAPAPKSVQVQQVNLLSNAVRIKAILPAIEDAPERFRTPVGIDVTVKIVQSPNPGSIRIQVADVKIGAMPVPKAVLRRMFEESEESPVDAENLVYEVSLADLLTESLEGVATIKELHVVDGQLTMVLAPLKP